MTNHRQHRYRFDWWWGIGKVLPPAALLVLTLALLPPPSSALAGPSSALAGPSSSAPLCTVDPDAPPASASSNTTHARAFCRLAITPTPTIHPFIHSVYAYDTILTIHIDRRFAATFTRDPLTAHSIMLSWVRIWRRVTGSRVVTVEARYGRVLVATGKTGWSGEDKVTIE